MAGRPSRLATSDAATGAPELPTPAAIPPRAASRWAGSTFTALQDRTYRIFWIGSALALLGFMMSSTAQSVVAFDLTGSNRAVGLVMFGQGLAMFLLIPFGGAFADRFSKRMLLAVCQTSIGLTLLVTAILIATGAITVLFLAAASFTMGVMFAFFGPARQAYVGEIVAPSSRGNAVALLQVAQNLMRVGGPFLAGALLAWPLVGSAGTFFVMASLFVVVVAMNVLLPPTTGRPRGAGSAMLREILVGVRYVGQNRRLLRLVVAFVLVTMVGFPYMTLVPGYVKGDLGQGTGSIGVLLGVTAVGGLLVSLMVASLADSPRAPLIQLVSSLGMGIGLLLTGMAPSFGVALLTMFVVGGASSGFQTLNNALTMRETEPAYFGRVMSITMLAYSTSALLALPIGLLADSLGRRTTFLLMGTAVCVVVGLLQLWAARPAQPRTAGARHR